MAVLNDISIKNLVQNHGMIDPFHLDLLQGASYDVCLGNEFLVQRKNIGHRKKFSEEVIVYHGDFILASTLEKFSIPDNISAELRLKSSRAREGISHALAVYADPGFVGQMTLELYIVGHRSVRLYGGMKIGQMIFIPTVEILEDGTIKNSNVLNSYRNRGHYQGQIGPTPSWTEE